ncbi:hypothetical protein HKCCE3408_15110 [Rhodobacterales bacterium HKCCE3408]|nr:hypothetical protein [Rhodobacterales bacterium HKCCE3408]
MTDYFSEPVADLPTPVAQHPGLITGRERALLFKLARDHYRGDGLIIDAGIFFGASTVAFAEGLMAAGRNPGSFRPIRSYDIAIWYERMGDSLDPEVLKSIFSGRDVPDGSSFEPELRKLIAPYDPFVDLVIGNMMQTASADRPVEIAFFDCLKTNERDLVAFRAFAPHYIPGHTIVLQQDYFYWGAAHNKIRQEYFADRFSFIGNVATTAVFRLEKPIPAADIAGDPVATLSPQRQVDLLRQAAFRVEDPRHRILTELSLVEHLIDLGELNWASQELEAQEAVLSAEGAPARFTRRPEQVARQLRHRIGKLEKAGT